jgi:hypothetical protein
LTDSKVQSTVLAGHFSSSTKEIVMIFSTEPIQGSSVLFRLAYWWKKESPDYVSVCARFWRTVISVVLVTPLGFFLGFWFAKRPPIFRNDLALDFFGPDQRYRMVYYRRWPRLGGSRIWPTPVLLIALLLYVFYQNLDLVMAGGILVLGSIVAYGIFSIVVTFLQQLPHRVRQTELYELIDEFIEARKSKFCPVRKVKYD